MAGKKKEKIGVVVSDKADKTITVKVERLMVHPFYGKVVKRMKKFLVHDKDNTALIGDKVLIRETRPISKRKYWKLVNVVEKGNETEIKKQENIE